MTNVLDLTVLRCGTAFAARPTGAGSDAAAGVVSEPILAYLVRTLNGVVLFDTGLDRRHLADPVRRAAMFSAAGWPAPPVVGEGEDLVSQLARQGLRAEDIDHVVVSHLHADRTGGLKATPRARKTLQRAEHAAAFAPDGAPDARYLPLDYDLASVTFDLVDGDTVLDEGLTVVATPGRTVGHQSLIVELAGTGPVILAAGACRSRADLAAAVPPSPCRDAAAALASLRRLDALAWTLGAEILVGDDARRVGTLGRAAEQHA
ncbi:N-acyl homoserine lactonase family protein [Acuticoccus sediminis]|uniref:N-acyl homoserine lactonase family protein n=1 Tax=Acuticoccus sediminis TaxID=2184697 RepID=UPI001CFEB81D|nr:N-acyl homoserine lactonase family protein [Acuticoccus sediminis]